MRIRELVRAEVMVILVIIGSALFFTGKAILGPSKTGMAVYDEGEAGKIYSKVQAGMSFDEIRAIFGEPDEVQKVEERGMLVEYCYYTKGDYILRVGFKDGKVDSKVVI